MPKVHTHYDNLKVARDAPIEVIEAAYKALAQMYHPDRNPGDTAARIRDMVQTAHAVLTNPERRREHDEWIRRGETHSEADSSGRERIGVSRSIVGRWRAAAVVAPILAGLGLWTWHRFTADAPEQSEQKVADVAPAGALTMTDDSLPATLPPPSAAFADRSKLPLSRTQVPALARWNRGTEPTAVGPDTPICAALALPPTSVLSSIYDRDKQSDWPHLTLKASNSVGNIYAKVTNADAGTSGGAVATMFIRKDSSEGVSLPPGEYKVRYVAANSWYGEEFVKECEARFFTEGDDTIRLDHAEHRKDGSVATDDVIVELWQQTGGNFPVREMPIYGF